MDISSKQDSRAHLVSPTRKSKGQLHKFSMDGSFQDHTGSDLQHILDRLLAGTIDVECFFESTTQICAKLDRHDNCFH